MTDLCKAINQLGKGLGNETRYRILETLLKRAHTVGELVDHFHLSQPAISQHLKTLKDAQLVSDERRGQEVYYQINAEHTLKLLSCLVEDIRQHTKRAKKV